MQRGAFIECQFPVLPIARLERLAGTSHIQFLDAPFRGDTSEMVGLALLYQ
jgi:hypothetical protein